MEIRFISIKMTLLAMVLYFLGGCTFIPKYTVSEEDIESYGSKYFKFIMFDFDWNLKPEPNKTKFYGKEYALIEEEFDNALNEYLGFKPKKDLDYWALSICYCNPKWFTYENRSENLKIIVDSVFMNIDSVGYLPIEIFPVVNIVRNINCSSCRYIVIAPLETPKSYNGDFKLKFDFMLYDMKADSLILEEPIEILCKRDHWFYSPLYQGR